MSIAINIVPFKPSPNGASPEGRRLLLKNGYEPLLLSGKRCLLDGWAAVEITADKLAQWESDTNEPANTGVRTGRLAVVDVDLLHPAHATTVAEEIQRVLGPNMFERIGSKGCALCYFNADPIRKIVVSGRPAGARKGDKTHKVEFLGQGQQLAAYGPHPDTGRPYAWPSGFSLMDSKLADLPEVSPDKLREAAGAAVKAMERLQYTDMKITGAGTNDFSRPPEGGNQRGQSPITAEWLENMLAYVDPTCGLNEWIGKMCAIKYVPLVNLETGESDEEFNRFDPFDRWSAGELNPKHNPGNYRGIGDTWFHWNSKSEQDARSDGTTIASIIQEAKDNGYDGPTYVSPQPDPTPEGEVSPLEKFRREEASPASGDVDEQTDVVTALNKEYAVVTGGKNNGRVVDLRDPREPQFLPKDRFHTTYQNRCVPIPTKKGIKLIPISKKWLDWADRREIIDIGFEPTGSLFPLPAGAHNIWRGFAVEPKLGHNHRELIAHLSRNVCRGDEEIFEWLLAWLADLVQQPGHKTGTAVALTGDFGAGKSILYDYLRKIFGDHAMKIAQPEHLTGRFNIHLSKLCLLGVEEGFWAGDRRAESVLKDLITAPELTVEQKFADPYTLHNHVHILVTSNADWAVPAALGDRRWAVLDVAPDEKDNRKYWAPIYQALEGDGPAHLLHYLLNFKYDRDMLFRPPMTAAKAEQTIPSLDTVSHWWLDVLRGERDPVASGLATVRNGGATDGVFENDTIKTILLDDYKEWCGDNKGRLADARQFWRTLREMVGPKLKQTKTREGDRRVPVVWLPPRGDCQTTFAEQVGCPWSDLASFDGEEDDG